MDIIDIGNLNSFLRIGYFLKYNGKKNLLLNFSGIDKEKYKKFSFEEISKIGSNIFSKIISKNFKPNKKHMIPLSGGIDSRMILAALLEHTEAKNIHTYTFGEENTWDYDFGNLVAKKAGTKHISFPQNKHHYSMDELIETSKRIDHQTIVFHHPPINEIVERFSHCLVWSGYIGDWFAGSHIPKIKSTNIIDAKRYIIKKQTQSKNFILSNYKIDDFIPLFECGDELIDKEKITYEEQIEAHNKLIKQSAPGILYNGFEYVLPFIDQDWVNFMLSQEDYFKNKLFRTIILTNYSALFKYPIKNDYGLTINAPYIFKKAKKYYTKTKRKINYVVHIFKDKQVNYLDFKNVIPKNKSLYNLLRELIFDLDKRNIIDWIEPKKIWELNMRKNFKYNEALLILASLEIHLKAGKKI